MAEIVRPEALREWVASLRYGGYRQCQHYLETYLPDGTVSYCALGVLGAVGGEDAAFLCLNSEVEDWVIRMNDDLGYSFSMIADRIEELFPEVFGDAAVVEEPEMELVHG